MNRIKLGSRGPEVREAQTLLKKAGFNPGPIDGYFGPLTAKAVRNYQKSKKLLIDGVIGPQTWASLKPKKPGKTQVKKQDPPKIKIPTNGAGAVIAFFENSLTRITTATELYKWFKNNGHYLYYLNAKYTLKQTINRIKQGQGVNCVNTHILVKILLEQRGYIVKYAHGKVKCNDGQYYGHVWLLVKGLEFGDTFINYDITGATKNGTKRDLGQLICIKGIKGEPAINEKWILELEKELLKGFKI